MKEKKKHKNWICLQAGDLVDVVAPGYPSPREQVEGGLLYLQKEWGLQARAPKDLIQKHFLHANSDEKRFAFLKAAIESPESKAIWCTRGGYGSNRLLPLLAKMKKPREPKLLIGLSDVTSLHCFFNQVWGWPTLHACVLDRLGRGALPKALQKELHGVLFGATATLEFKNLKPLNDVARKTQKISAQIVGGNLTVLQSTLATPFEIQTADSLLFVEDIGERGYRIDRMFEQFRQAGLFEKCRGILLGHFLGGEEPQTKKNNFKQVFERWSRDLEIPLWSGIEAGHDVKQRTLPLHTPCVLEKSGDRHVLSVKTGGVKRE
jgi:muramoyltetrapeptide carboxypeptidase